MTMIEARSQPARVWPTLGKGVTGGGAATGTAAKAMMPVGVAVAPKPPSEQPPNAPEEVPPEGPGPDREMPGPESPVEYPSEMPPDEAPDEFPQMPFEQSLADGAVWAQSPALLQGMPPCRSRA